MKQKIELLLSVLVVVLIIAAFLLRRQFGDSTLADVCKWGGYLCLLGSVAIRWLLPDADGE